MLAIKILCERREGWGKEGSKGAWIAGWKEELGRCACIDECT